ncbi:MAG: hypothetical protein AAFR81_30165 [Chloroflexota bacterium]
MADSGEPVVLHNPWMVMLAEADNETPGIIQLSRPQDWGNPKWHYREVTLVVEIAGTVYESHAHVWIDVEIEDADLMQYNFFRECVFSVQYPGANPKVCGRDYLDQDDFWQDSWGDMPPHLDPDEDDWEPYYGG